MASDKDVDAAFLRGKEIGEQKEKLANMRAIAFRRKVDALLKAALPGCKKCDKRAHFIVIPKEPKADIYHLCAECKPLGGYYIKQRQSYSSELGEVEDG